MEENFDSLAGDYHYVLIVHPYVVVSELHEKGLLKGKKLNSFLPAKAKGIQRVKTRIEGKIGGNLFRLLAPCQRQSECDKSFLLCAGCSVDKKKQ